MYYKGQDEKIMMGEFELHSQTIKSDRDYYPRLATLYLKGSKTPIIGLEYTLSTKPCQTRHEAHLLNVRLAERYLNTARAM